MASLTRSCRANSPPLSSARPAGRTKRFPKRLRSPEFVRNRFRGDLLELHLCSGLAGLSPELPSDLRWIDPHVVAHAIGASLRNAICRPHSRAGVSTYRNVNVAAISTHSRTGTADHPTLPTWAMPAIESSLKPTRKTKK